MTTPAPPTFAVDFNELIERDLVLLSRTDERVDVTGVTIRLVAGMDVAVCDEDFDASGKRDDLVATGVVERNGSGFAAHVKWCCRIDASGIRHASVANGQDVTFSDAD